MNYPESLILGFISAAGISAWFGTIIAAFLIGFVGAIGGLCAKLLYDYLKKRFKLKTNKPFKNN